MKYRDWQLLGGHRVLPAGSYLPWCGFACAVWHVWAPAEPLWVCISPALVVAALLRKWLSFCTQTGNPMGQEAPPVLRV